ncbi:MAG TPA: adenylyltransferase/cytidyltransferase family protein, partial [Candidatus Dormibacteraeota bacterium]
MTSRTGPASELDQVIFGGTFDPPHVGHLAVIRGLRALTGQLIVVMPSGIPGHRPAPTASAEDRADLVELAVAALGDPRVRVCRHEAEREEPSFTVDT